MNEPTCKWCAEPESKCDCTFVPFIDSETGEQHVGVALNSKTLKTIYGRLVNPIPAEPNAGRRSRRSLIAPF